ncbi:hypothetical protein LXL04_026098 [Taraxacum kok-saghyz]
MTICLTHLQIEEGLFGMGTPRKPQLQTELTYRRSENQEQVQQPPQPGTNRRLIFAVWNHFKKERLMLRSVNSVRGTKLGPYETLAVLLEVPRMAPLDEPQILRTLRVNDGGAGDLNGGYLRTSRIVRRFPEGVAPGGTLRRSRTHEKKEIRTWNSVEVAGAAQSNSKSSEKKKNGRTRSRRRMAELEVVGEEEERQTKPQSPEKKENEVKSPEKNWSNEVQIGSRMRVAAKSPRKSLRE